MSCIETPKTTEHLTVPAQTFESGGIFWLDPKVIEDAGSLINSTHLTTMALGAETHSMESPVTRSIIHHMFISEDDPLREELVRAIDIGFMYGGLIAARSHSNRQDPADGPESDTYEKLPMTLLGEMEDANRGLDSHSAQDNYTLFMRLRNLEVQRAHSDVLAFSLASTQDHMGSEFERNRHSDEMYDSDTLRRFQTMFYAGALAGGLLKSSSEDLDRPTVEIIRSMIGYVEPISHRIEMQFESGDAENLEEIIDGALRAKLVFSVQRPKNDAPFVAVYPSSLQYGPNVLSFPIYFPGIEEPMALKKVPLDELDAVVIEKHDPENGAVTDISLIDDPEAYLEDPDENSEIVGLVQGKLCITKYDSVHPNAQGLKHLVEAFKGKKAKNIKYVNGLEAREPFTIKHGYAWLAGLGISAIWITDFLGGYANNEVDWQLDASSSGLFVLGLAGIALARKVLRTRVMESEQNYQKLLDRNNPIL
ncbi:MAG: hypothetical protein ACHQT9_02495 [Candidatus Saccharimonadales bacterium]